MFKISGTKAANLKNEILLRNSGRAGYLYSTALKTQLTYTWLEDFLLTSALADFTDNLSQIKHNNDYKLL